MPDALPALRHALTEALGTRDETATLAVCAALRSHPDATEGARLAAEAAELRMRGFRSPEDLARLPVLYDALAAEGEPDAQGMVGLMLGITASRRNRVLDLARHALDVLDLAGTSPSTRAGAARLLASAWNRLGRVRARREALEVATDLYVQGHERFETAQVAVELAQARVVLGEPVDLDALAAICAASTALMPRCALEDIRATAASQRGDLVGMLRARRAFEARATSLGRDEPMYLQARIALGRLLVTLRDPDAAEVHLAPLPHANPRLETERSFGGAQLHLRRGEVDAAAQVLAEAPPAFGIDRATRVALDAAVAVRSGRTHDAGRALAELSIASGRKYAPFAEATEMFALWSDLPETAVVPRTRLLAAVVDRIDAPLPEAELRAARKAGAPIPVGPWDLERRIAAGGMGEVWRARHVATGTSSAIKLLKRHGGKSGALEALEREARLIASLRHPGIVELYGTGPISRSAEIASGGALAEGTPWVAMQFVHGGTLAPFCGELDWPVVRALLLNLLDALAHAHGRDVLHLDIKPHNVLIERDGDALTAKLTDFGMAWLRVADTSLDGRVAGTPVAMAPEQWLGRWRTFGPETDLYALGCLAWQLVTGSFLYPMGPPLELREAHCRGPIPPFAPRRPVPAGLFDWLCALLQKAPQDRPAAAADAAVALAGLGGALIGGDVDGPVQAVRAVDTTLCLSDVLARVPEPDAPRGLPTAPPTLPAPVSASSVPDAEGQRLVGRDREKRALWSAFLEAAQGSGPVRAALVGPRGVGSTALVDWLCQQAATLGASVLRVRRTDATAADLLRRWFQLTPEDPEATVRRHLTRFAAHRVGPDVLARCAAVLAGTDDPGAPAALVGGLQGSVVVLDLGDLDERAAPVLARLGEVEGRALVLGCGERAGFRRVDVGPLDPAVLAGVLEQTFELRPADARSVAHTVGGRLAEAVGLVRALRDRELLLRLPDGFAVPDGRLLAGLAAAPDERLAPEDLPQLQVAAVLGDRFAADDFRALAAVMEAHRPGLDALAVRGVLEAPGRGGSVWRFVDGAVRREALRACAPRALRELHARAAEVVADPRARVQHRLAAGQVDAALDEALAAVRAELLEVDPRGVAADLLRDALEQVDPARTRPAWAELWLAASERAAWAGQHDQALALARDALADAAGEEALRARAILRLADYSSLRGPLRGPRPQSRPAPPPWRSGAQAPDPLLRLAQQDAIHDLRSDVEFDSIAPRKTGRDAPDADTEALRAVLAGLSEGPLAAELRWRLAVCAGDTDGQRAQIEAWELTDPPRAERAQAEICAASGDLRRASAHLAAAALRDPRPGPAHRDHLQAATWLRQAGDPGAAASCLARARALEGERPSAWGALSSALLAWREGRWSEARREMDGLASIGVGPEDLRAVSLLRAVADEPDDSEVVRLRDALGPPADPRERAWLLATAAWTALHAGYPGRAGLFRER